VNGGLLLELAQVGSLALSGKGICAGDFTKAGAAGMVLAMVWHLGWPYWCQVATTASPWVSRSLVDLSFIGNGVVIPIACWQVCNVAYGVQAFRRRTRGMHCWLLPSLRLHDNTPASMVARHEVQLVNRDCRVVMLSGSTRISSVWAVALPPLVTCSTTCMLMRLSGNSFVHHGVTYIHVNAL
jgi:hypothetical protein